MPYIEHDGKRILFIHIPKTGGTTIETWLEGIAPLNMYCRGVPQPLKVTPQHFRWSDVSALFAEGSFDYCFTVVRDPYKRLESEYKMRWIGAQEGLWGGVSAFPVWLENQLHACRINPNHLDNHLMPQWQFIGDQVNVFHFEDGLERIIAQICEETGLPAPETVAHKISSETFEGEIDWDFPDVIRANKFYAEDFKNLGYEKRAEEPVEEKPERKQAGWFKRILSTQSNAKLNRT